MNREEAKSEVGVGWHSLIDECFDELPLDSHVSQVKEKFGELRFYYYGGDDQTDEIIDSICDRSRTICEECGEPGVLRYGSWLKTLCEKHYETWSLR